MCSVSAIRQIENSRDKSRRERKERDTGTERHREVQRERETEACAFHFTVDRRVSTFRGGVKRERRQSPRIKYDITSVDSAAGASTLSGSKPHTAVSMFPMNRIIRRWPRVAGPGAISTGNGPVPSATGKKKPDKGT